MVGLAATAIWPFDEETCPVHDATNEQRARDAERGRFDTWPPRAVELYKRVRELELQVAMLRCR
jgi:hypothetical protein